MLLTGNFDGQDVDNMTSFRGIVVIPELDAPGNLGAGWQAVDPDFTLCVERHSIFLVFCLIVFIDCLLGTPGITGVLCLPVAS